MLRSRFLLALTVAAAALFPGCIFNSSEGLFSDTITLTDLNPKVLPITIVADEDPKDTVYKSRTRYKPNTAPLFFPPKDLRLLLRGKRDGAAIRTVLDRDFFATEYEIHMRLAFDPNKTKGLVDGESLGFLELVLDTGVEGAPPFRRIEAVYDGTNNGFNVQATDGTTPLGTPVAFNGESEVVLQFRFDGAELFMEGGAVTGPFVFEFTPTLIHSQILVTEGLVRQTVAWGASALGKKGSLFINQLTLEGVLPDIGAVETPIAMNMESAFSDGFTAGFSGTFETVATAIEDMRANLVNVVAQLETAFDQGTLGPVTQGKRALKNANKALKLATKGKTIADKQAGGAEKTKPINKKARQSLTALQLAFAQLAGFKSNKAKRVAKTGFLPFGF